MNSWKLPLKLPSVLLTALLAWCCFALAIPARAADEVRKIQPGDTLAISVVNEAELTQAKRVDANGKFTYWLLGAIDTTGKTVTQVEKEIRDKLDKDYIINPGVSVEIKSYAEIFFNVLGAVNAPGRIPYPPDRRIDVIDAIAFARDFNRLANTKEIELRRDGKLVATFSYDDVKKQVDPAKKISVEPNDTIYVKETRF